MSTVNINGVDYEDAGLNSMEEARLSMLVLAVMERFPDMTEEDIRAISNRASMTEEDIRAISNRASELYAAIDAGKSVLLDGRKITIADENPAQHEITPAETSL